MKNASSLITLWGSKFHELVNYQVWKLLRIGVSMQTLMVKIDTLAKMHIPKDHIHMHSNKQSGIKLRIFMFKTVNTNAESNYQKEIM